MLHFILREGRLYVQRPMESLAPLWSFCLMISLFLMLFQYSPALLNEAAPAFIWVAVLIAVFMSVESLLRADYEAGVLEQWIFSVYPLPYLCLSKIVAHLLWVGIPFLILGTGVACLLNMKTEAIQALCLSLALGLPLMSLMIYFGALLSIGLNQGGWLLSILILPLLLPLLFLGLHAVQSAAQSLPWQADIWLLLALLFIGIAFIPKAMAVALALSLECA
jgi:heme exporter protein B